jgi:hypothetical protein
MSALVKAGDGDAVDAPQRALGVNQSAELGFGQVDLADIAGNHCLGAKAHAG